MSDDDDDSAVDYCIAYVGCYTRPNQADPFYVDGDSNNRGVPHDQSKVGVGVVALRVSTDGGQLGHLGITENNNTITALTTDIPNPSYLTITPKGEKLYVCVTSEIEEGKVHTFFINNATNPAQLERCGNDGLATNGSYPCHVSSFRSDTGETIVLVSNYGSDDDGGVVAQFILDENDKLIRLTSISHGPIGSRINMARQVASHAHCCIKASDTEVLCADLGADVLVQYRLHDDGLIVPSGRLSLPRGSGPRSIALCPIDPTVAIVSLEITAQIQLVGMCGDDDTRGWECVGEPVSVLPEGWPDDGDDDDVIVMGKFNHGKWASDAVWSRNGRYVFAAARLYNHISVFRLRQQQQVGHCYSLELVDRIPTKGITPRCLSVSPCGRILLVAHQHSHDVTSFLVDETTGRLTFADTIEVPLAACVVMMIPAPK